MKSKLVQNKKDDLTRCKDEIKEIIESEIVARYYFQKGRPEASFKHDAEVKEALRVLGDKQMYASILKGYSAYKTIGKPKPETLVNAGTHTQNSN